jgi:hypothetical protein
MALAKSLGTVGSKIAASAKSLGMGVARIMTKLGGTRADRIEANTRSHAIFLLPLLAMRITWTCVYIIFVHLSIEALKLGFRSLVATRRR